MIELPPLAFDALLVQLLAGAFICGLVLGAAAGVGIGFDVARTRFSREG